MKKQVKNLTSCLIVIVFIFLTTLVIAQPSTKDNIGKPTSATETVNNHRDLLKNFQRTFIDSLPVGAKNLSVDLYLEKLRENLRNKVISAISGKEGGEVDLAVKRAAVRDHLVLIEAYEAAYGKHKGVPTTKWNVFTFSDLTEIKKHLNKIFRELNVSIARYPSDQIPEPLLGKSLEVRAELDAVIAERVSRHTNVQPKLMVISNEVTAPDKKAALSKIEQIEYSKAQFYVERALYIEIQERLNWNPNDAALKSVKKNIEKHKYSKKLLAQRFNKKKDGWPPKRPQNPPGKPDVPPHSPKGRGSPSPYPLKPSGGAMLNDLRETITSEMDAFVERDKLKSTDAKARLTVTTTRVQHLTGTVQSPLELGIASMSNAELNKYDENLREWQKALILERDSRPISSWHGEQELKDTKVRLKILGNEIHIRGPPPDKSAKGLHGSKEIQNAIDRIPTNSRSVAYENTWKVSLEHQRILELRAELDRSIETNNIALKKALSKQETRRLYAEVEAINKAWKQALKAERSSLINGRGIKGSQAARLAAQSKYELRVQADALRGLIDSYQKQEINGAKQLKRTSILPPTGTGVGAEAFRPNAIFDITFKLQGAKYLSSPPLVDISGLSIPESTIPKALKFNEYFNDSKINSASAYRKNPKFAPGGIVVDLKLPSKLTNRISKIKYDADNKLFYLLINSNWLTLTPKVSPETARAALAFVLDGRVAAIDIGSFDFGVQMWLAEKGVLNFKKSLSSNEEFGLLQAQRLLKVVRINPSLANTDIASALVSADELIFSVLSLDTILLASDRFFRGIDTLELHNILQREKLRLGKKWYEATSYKSLLTVEKANVKETSNTVHVSVGFTYNVYALPHRLNNLSKWFDNHSKELRANSPELMKLVEFSVAVSVLRIAMESNKLDNFLEIASLIDNSPKSARLLCRSYLSKECDIPFIKNIIAQTPETIEE